MSQSKCQKYYQLWQNGVRQADRVCETSALSQVSIDRRGLAKAFPSLPTTRVEGDSTNFTRMKLLCLSLLTGFFHVVNEKLLSIKAGLISLQVGLFIISVSAGTEINYPMFTF